MKPSDEKQRIESSLREFSSLPLAEAGIKLFATLGYESDRRFRLKPNSPDNFLASFAQHRSFNREQGLLEDWNSVDFLFQLTDAEVRSAGQTSLTFDSSGAFDGSIIESYLFLAIDLKQARYSRTQLSGVTRSVNRLFDMPVMLLFRHGDSLTLSIIRRRLHKRDESKDVLEKVTLIKDINFGEPLRAHIEIFYDLSLQALYDEFYFQNFVSLHRAWEKRLDSYALNERFYRDIANWYFWALSHENVIYPRDVHSTEEESIFLIRLLTRLIFCWFLQEKDLIPRDILRRRYADQILKDFSPRSGSFYRAFLQNLFFATLNQEPENRGFRKKYAASRDGNRGVTNLFRYADLLKDPEAFVQKLSEVPFVNGGLFDCLDVVYDQGRRNLRLDDFSEEKKNDLRLPNELFFGEEREVDLSDVYGDAKKRREKVRGLVEILNRYKFTIEENTPLEQEIALDPELLGRVFENLLASYNEDTRTTARKATGSFYTRREIVSYMVDESLVSYIQSAVGTNSAEFESKLRQVLDLDLASFENPFAPAETDRLIDAIDKIKVLDPACGSGAFLMGALHRLVDLLKKLDRNNERWRELQRRRAIAETEKAFRIGDKEERKHRLNDINEVFEQNSSDYGRKLYLIENCIYGVDIQPIACQIAKLRFFIALIVDQKVNRTEKNSGVRPLPNLEAKIVAADTLVPIERPEHHQFDLLHAEVLPLRERLQQVRHEYFSARTPAKKRRCREEDAQLRSDIAGLLRHGGGFTAGAAKAMANWDPYDQNAHATFFDSEWMFGLPIGKVRISRESPATLLGHFSFINEAVGQMEFVESKEVESGFDIIIGNPPYIRIQTLKQKDPNMVAFLKEHYQSARKGNYDIYVVFVERGMQLLKRHGTLAYILPHKFFNAQYGEPLRYLISRDKNLKHVVHFGDAQVFPGATNYVCLLFLSRNGSDFIRFVKVLDFQQWLDFGQGTEARIPAAKITAEEWNFAVGREAEIVEQLGNTPLRLADVAERIFQGLVTGADPVFILHEAGHGKFASDATGAEHEIEKALMHPLCKGALDIRRWRIGPVSRSILFPYHVQNDHAELISVGEMKKQYPRAWKYLLLNRRLLESREGGKWEHERWYAFGRSQNLAEMEQLKILTPSIASSASFTLDRSREYYFVGSGGGGGGGYGITLKDQVGLRIEYVLALLNSAALDFYLKHISSRFSGGYYAYNRQYIQNLPIPKGSESEQASISLFVDYLLWLNGDSAIPREDADKSEHTLMVAYFEQIVNGLVYELFFPDELHEAKLFPFELIAGAKLPTIKDFPNSELFQSLRKTFRQLYDTNHKLRGCLHDLGSLRIVRVIEGRD